MATNSNSINVMDGWVVMGIIGHVGVWFVLFLCAYTHTLVNNPTINRFRTNAGLVELIWIAWVSAVWFIVWALLLFVWEFWTACAFMYGLYCIVAKLLGDMMVMKPLYKLHHAITLTPPEPGSRVVLVPEGSHLEVVAKPNGSNGLNEQKA